MRAGYKINILFYIMLIIQIGFLITFIYFVLAYSYIVLTPAILLGNMKLINFSKSLSQTLITFMLTYAFNTKLFLNQPHEKIKKVMNENPNNIDIIVANHVSTSDFIILMSYLQKFNIDSYNFVFKNSIVYWPGFGLIMYSNPDIKLERNWNVDQKNLGKEIDNIPIMNKKQVIIIFPEGTRFTLEKLKEAQQFSLENNLPKYNNLLVPKSKGLWFIVNQLAKKNRLGRIWDMTLVLPKFLGKESYLSDIVGKEIGNVYCDIRELKLPANFEDNNIFKNWLHENWKIKDKYIEQYNKYQYEKITFNDMRYNHLIFITFIIFLATLLLYNKYGRYYLFFSIILSYILIIFKL